MSTGLFIDKVASYLTTLTATNAICDSLGTTLKFGTNLFVGYDPDSRVDTISLIPYGGRSPNPDKYRQESSFQINVKVKGSNKRRKAQTTVQAFINELHMREISTYGKVFSAHSSVGPLIEFEGTEWVVGLCNFNTKHIKI